MNADDFVHNIGDAIATTNIISTNYSYDLSSHLTPSQGSEAKDNVLEAIPFVKDGLDGGWFGKIGTSVSLLFGTFGNFMTIVILRNLRAGWSAMNVYLTALAMSDTAVLYSGMLSLWTRKMFSFDLFASHIVACKLGIWIMNTGASISSWLLVTLTAQRAASVVWPHRVNLICTQQRSIIVIVIIVIFMGTLYGHTLFEYELVKVNDDVLCTFGRASYQQFWVTIWVWLDMFFYSLLPCLFLICSNAILVWKLTHAVRTAGKKLSATTATEDRKKKASSATITIVIVSSAFVVLTIPLMVYNLFFQNYASEDEESRAFHYFLYEFFFIIGVSNFSWNFYLYCLTGSRFRRQFFKIMFGICCCCCRSSNCRCLSADSSSVSSGNQAVEMSSGQKQLTDAHDDF